ncbi:MAG TPA: hypothetical protein VER76_16615 [Pyrinomonadaceae bacterium]|nr:hypothetical protein [Pyrinomonadaceae bacterium]
MKKLLRTISLALLVVCGVGFGAAGDARADVKIKTRNTSSGQSSEQVTYIKGKRQRTEQSAASVLITQCDLRRTLQLGVPTKTYLMTPFDQKLDASATAAEQSPATNTQQAVRRGGIITSTFTSTDTGERKKMFGYTARHIKTSIVTESSPDACQVSRSRMETDGWYIDAAFALDCDYAAGMSFMRSTEPGGCRDQYRSKQVGVARLGYPVMVTTTLFDDNGQASYTFTQEVLEISNAVLDSALFEAPADYRQVSDYREIYGMPATNSANDSDTDAASGGGASGANAGAAKTGSRASTKRAGVVRVGVPMTMTGLTGDNVNAEALAEAVRRALMSNLNNASVEVVALEAQQPQQAESEAKAKECDYILYSTVAHKKGGGGGGFGGFLKKSAAIASEAVAPTSNGGSSSGAASSLKAKDELTLEYKLERGAERLLANTIKAKAKSDGEDLISQLAGQAAAAVRAAAATTK